MSRGAAESARTATTTSPAIPPPPVSHTRAPELGHLEDAQGNGSITVMGPQGHAAETLPSQQLGFHFWGRSAQHLLPPLLHPSQRKVIYPSPREAKPSCSSDASGHSIPTPPRARSCRARPITRGTRPRKPLPQQKCRRGEGRPVAIGVHIHNSMSFASLIAPLTATPHQETIRKIFTFSSSSRGEAEKGLGAVIG